MSADHIDDILEPPVPPAVLEPLPEAPIAQASKESCTFNDHEALLLGFSQALQKRLMEDVFAQANGMLKVLDAVYAKITGTVEQLTASHRATQADLVGVLQQGLLVRKEPFMARIQGISPAGFVLTLEVVKEDAQALVTAVEAMMGWLEGQGYTGLHAASAQEV